METKVRSGSKSVIWRLFGVAILAAITYAYTRKWITTGLITVIHHGVFLFVFYFHERLWLRVKRVKYRSLLKMFTYETLCGNIILGMITYTITGSWKQMTAITLTYIGIKHVCYVFNEFVWDRIKIGMVGLLIIALLMPSTVYGDYWTNNAVKVGAFGLSTEIRMDSEVYHRHVQIDWRYKINDYIAVAMGLREIYNTGSFEHNPLFDTTYGRGAVKNRLRVQMRMTEPGNVWQYRNKTTVKVSRYYAAYEAFREEGTVFRNRYYVGGDINSNLGIFILYQETRGECLWTLGVNVMLGLLR